MSWNNKYHCRRVYWTDFLTVEYHLLLRTHWTSSMLCLVSRVGFRSYSLQFFFEKWNAVFKIRNSLLRWSIEFFPIINKTDKALTWFLSSVRLHSHGIREVIRIYRNKHKNSCDFHNTWCMNIGNTAELCHQVTALQKNKSVEIWKKCLPFMVWKKNLQALKGITKKMVISSPKRQ